MNTSEMTGPVQDAEPRDAHDLTIDCPHDGQQRQQPAGGFLFQLLVRLFRGERRPPSILRNNTNLPVFLVLALGLSLVCNFALRESSAHASRAMGPVATLQEALNLLAQDPQNPAVHSHLGELYMRERNYKRAMFHLREASRLGEVFGE